ncbi:MAG: hypothetical protein HWN81_05755 [Candidatus Lokiarchaeota archaeon]|nr:hypothetical protein [Candidatus Lokiarchaeota archaeon]
MVKPVHKFKIFKSDAAPFFFYIEIFPLDLAYYKIERTLMLLKKINTNPIMPLPMRVDRVFNGEKSLLIRPKEPISFSIMDDLNATINPTAFLQYGTEKLIYFAEIRAFEKFVIPLKIEKVNKWWESTKFLYAKLSRIEEDFSAFLRAYLSTVLKAKLNNEDLINAATNYCKIIQEVCEKRINENSILIETTRKETNVRMYMQKVAKYREKMKRVERVEYHPELVDIDIYDLAEKGFKYNIDKQDLFLDDIKPKEIKYIPLLFYDDLLECMLQNLKKLDEGDDDILDPTFMLDKNIITLQNSKELDNINTQEFSWFSPFEELNFESSIQSIRSALLDYFKTKGYIDKNTSNSSSSPSSSR